MLAVQFANRLWQNLSGVEMQLMEMQEICL